MIDYQPFFHHLKQGPLHTWVPYLEDLTQELLAQPAHGQWDKWMHTLKHLPKISPSTIDLQSDVIQVGSHKENLDTQLQAFRPWRKGPFHLFGTHIDTEWQSQLKWNRLCSHISPLQGRTVADIGAGNGYFSWRMLGEGAQTILSVDITLLYIVQFWVFQRYIQNPTIGLLPLSLEQLNPIQNAFDTVFSMGVLYHAKNPHQHLQQLHKLLKTGGELVLETLYIEDQHGPILELKNRYAKMRNVYQLPSISTATEWLDQSGFSKIRCVNTSITSQEEQRQTEWMTFESLKDFLNPKDITRTCEGHPAPRRVIFIAER